MATIFNKVLKGIGSAVKTVAKPLLGTVAAAASVIPLVGPVVGAVANNLVDLLPDNKQKAIVNAVERDGVVKVEEIESTIAKNNPSITTSELIEATKGMIQVASALVPTATISDSNAITNVSFMDKAIVFARKYKAVVIGGGLVLFGFLAWLFFGKKRGGKRRRY